MEGVILFADDKLMDYTSSDGGSSHENQLFRALSASNPVLGVNERKQIERSINSIGSFSAVILDWQFDNEDNIEDEPEDDETVGPPINSMASMIDSLSKLYYSQKTKLSKLYYFLSKLYYLAPIGLQKNGQTHALPSFGLCVGFPMGRDMLCDLAIPKVRDKLCVAVKRWFWCYVP